MCVLNSLSILHTFVLVPLLYGCAPVPLASLASRDIVKEQPTPHNRGHDWPTAREPAGDRLGKRREDNRRKMDGAAVVSSGHAAVNVEPIVDDITLLEREIANGCT